MLAILKHGAGNEHIYNTSWLLWWGDPCNRTFPFRCLSLPHLNFFFLNYTTPGFLMEQSLITELLVYKCEGCLMLGDDATYCVLY